MFREAAPMTAAEAASEILAGVLAGRWRLLIGQDAVQLDEAVRADPEKAYGPGGLTLGALGVAAVIAHAVMSPDAPLSRVLAATPLVWLGRVSYGVYLWHWPLFGLLTADRTGLHGGPLLTLRLAGTLALAAASYVLVERPIRTGRWPRVPLPARVSTIATPRATRAAVGLGTACALVATIALVVVGTAPPQLADAAPVIAMPTATPKDGALAPIARAGRKPGTEPRVTFFGDSVSWSLGHYLPPQRGLRVTVRAIQGCGIARLPELIQLGVQHTNYAACPTWDERWRRGVSADDPDVAVILLDRWELMDRRLGGVFQHVGQPDYDVYLSMELELAITIAGSRGAHVTLLTAPYTRRSERWDGGLYDEDLPERVDAWNRLLRQVAARHGGRVSVLDLNALMCPDGQFTWTIDGLRVRTDGLHFTPEAVRRLIAPWLLPRLARIALGGRP
jgi:hypothetical protein